MILAQSSANLVFSAAYFWSGDGKPPVAVGTCLGVLSLRGGSIIAGFDDRIGAWFWNGEACGDRAAAGPFDPRFSWRCKTGVAFLEVAPFTVADATSDTTGRGSSNDATGVETADNGCVKFMVAIIVDSIDLCRQMSWSVLPTKRKKNQSPDRRDCLN